MPGLIIKSSKFYHLQRSTLIITFGGTIWWNYMDLSIRKRTINNSKLCRTFCLKFGHLSFTSLTNLLLQATVGICSTIKENLLSYCCEFLVFAILVITERILTTRYALKRKKPLLIEMINFAIEPLAFKSRHFNGAHFVSDFLGDL